MSPDFAFLASLENISSEEIYSFKSAKAILGDSFDVLEKIPDESIHAIVTDPPYGVKEFNLDQLAKMQNGSGGIWRIPPSFDGSVRAPLPRFTALTKKEKDQLAGFFNAFGSLIFKKLLPGAHIFLASNSFLSQLVFSSVSASGLEFRGEVIRLVQTLRGGDRPKNAENEFPEVCSLPRGTYEPWGLFRKPLPEKMTVAESLRIFGTGGLRRKKDGLPFSDVIKSERTPNSEKSVAPHPSLKPQSFLRELVYSSLPLGQGVVLDPFMGSGSTLAAASSIGYSSLGIEINQEFFTIAKKAIPILSTENLEYIKKYQSSEDSSLTLFASGS